MSFDEDISSAQSDIDAVHGAFRKSSNAEPRDRRRHQGRHRCCA
jgi:hypothetical protein